MKGTEFERLVRKHILGKLPGFQVRKRLVFMHPFEYLLRGFCCDPSGFDRNAFYVWAFVQPLFVLDEGLAFTLGDRFGVLAGKPNRCWEVTGGNEERVMQEVYECILKEGQPFLAGLSTLRSFVDKSGKFTDHTGVLQGRAYGAILLGDRKAAEKLLDQHEKEIQSYGPLRDWEVTELERTRLVRRTFHENPQEAVNLLNAWRDQTVENLGLTKFTEPMSSPSC